jgi:prepilin signal peptidase PulO-like enzyme (type II secretory pathway)
MGPIVAALAGWIAGIFINYSSDVLPAQRKLGKAFCPKCGSSSNWQHYLFFNKCLMCGRATSARDYVVVIFAVIASVFIWLYPPAQLNYILGLLVLTYFGVVVVIDLEHRLILHPVSLVGAILGFAVGIAAHGITATLLGGLAGLVIMGVLYFVGALFARYRARKLGKDDNEEALGSGDVILAGILGLMLGWPFIWFGLLLGILAGGLISLIIIAYLLLSKKYQTMSFFIAYGPYLILGAVLVMFVIVPVKEVIVK